VYKAITNSKKTFHIVGGGADHSSVNNSVSTGYDFFASCFNTAIKNVNTKQPGMRRTQGLFLGASAKRCRGGNNLCKV
jgi:hypothetical protein